MSQDLTPFKLFVQTWWPVAAVIVVLVICWVIARKYIPWAAFKTALTTPDSLQKKVAVWALSSILCFAVANAAFFAAVKLAPHQVPNAAMVFSVFWAVATAILILLLIFSMDDVKPAYGVLAAITGGVLGWLIGMYISPEGTSEQQQFAKIGTAVVGLFSGYTLKVVIDWLKDDKNKVYRVYCLFFALSALVSTAAVYNTRAYGNKEVKISFPENLADPKDKQKIAVEPSTDVTLSASVTGVPDTSVTWEIVPKPSTGSSSTAEAPTLTAGHFSASVADTYKVLARSNYDPRLSDVVEITVAKK